jgi:hypothetical protein
MLSKSKQKKIEEITDRLTDFPNRVLDVVDVIVVLLVLALILLAATVAEAVTNVHRAEPVKYEAFLYCQQIHMHQFAYPNDFLYHLIMNMI